MNYLNCYLSLIKKAKSREIPEFFEKHHIIPKSIFCNSFANAMLNKFNIQYKNGKDNIVYFTPKEHCVAHRLLVVIFRNKNTDAYERMLYAFNLMANRTVHGKVSSRKYELLKAEFSAMMSEKLAGKPSRAKGCKWSEERRKLGQPNLKGKTYEEIHGKEKAEQLKRQRADSKRGKKRSKETCKKLSEREITPEWRRKISNSRKGKLLDDTTKQKISAFMSNDLLNPNVDQTEYIFENINSGERIKARKIDMKKKYGCNAIHKVINGIRNHSKGWTLVELKENKNGDQAN